MNYDYDSISDSLLDYCEEFTPVNLDRIIRYVYCINDFFCNELVNFNNQEMQASYAVEPTSFLVLSDDTELFKPNNYPEMFAEWFMEMVDVTKKITDNE